MQTPTWQRPHICRTVGLEGGGGGGLVLSHLSTDIVTPELEVVDVYDWELIKVREEGGGGGGGG